ncbi:hypothetical protein DL98DRAFT_433052 [Cadophora sp. DSE1049]|nr:hypothetical protein DL98DRAFT_433052 [Cadophora sp. DSE1049]
MLLGLCGVLAAIPGELPTRVIAGVTVPDTPLITKALEFAREHLSDFTYNHVIRSWLYGEFLCSQLPEFQHRDVELHAITAILHDMGWAISGNLVSTDKRFEIDGAEATRKFLMREGKKHDWDKHRLQLAWDTVALHTTISIAMEKEPEVKGCAVGIMSDFLGPEKAYGGVLTKDVWESVKKEFPRLGFRKSINDTMCGLCKTKPQATYDNFAADFGTAYIEGYSRAGTTVLDILIAAED